MSDETHEVPKEGMLTRDSIFHVKFAWLAALAEASVAISAVASNV